MLSHWAVSARTPAKSGFVRSRVRRDVATVITSVQRHLTDSAGRPRQGCSKGTPNRLCGTHTHFRLLRILRSLHKG
jgi:hypothetical protein